MSVVLRITRQKLDPEGVLKQYHLEPGGLAQQTLEKAIIDYSIPYCPHDQGVLENSPYNATVRGSGVVKYPGPYAHYLYFGIVYAPSFPIFEDDSGIPTKWRTRKDTKKHPTGKFLTYKTDTNKDAGPFWVERMLANHRKDIVKEVADVAGFENIK